MLALLSTKQLMGVSDRYSVVSARPPGRFVRTEAVWKTFLRLTQYS